MKTTILTLLCLVASSYGQNSGDVYPSVVEADITVQLTNMLNAYNYNIELAVAVMNIGPTAALDAPKIYIDNCCSQLYPQSIPVGNSGLIVFGSDKRRGPEGVICYNLSGLTHMVCVLYGVTRANNQAFNVKLYGNTVAVDRDLYKHMNSLYGGVWDPYTGAYQTRTEYGVVVSATMTTGESVTYVVSVDATAYDAAAVVPLHYGCDVKAIGDDLCWRECNTPPYGQCQIAHPCVADADCAAIVDPTVYLCSTACSSGGVIGGWGESDDAGDGDGGLPDWDQHGHH